MHQHTCPHCQKAAVPNLAVRWSSREIPARCSACGGLCHVVASSSSGIGVFTFVLLAAAGAAGLAMQSVWVGCAAGTGLQPVGLAGGGSLADLQGSF